MPGSSRTTSAGWRPAVRPTSGASEAAYTRSALEEDSELEAGLLTELLIEVLDRNASGGMHHLCYEVADIGAARDRLRAEGARVLGDGEPRTGAHGKPVLFLHPKDFCGTLIELEQV